MKFAITNMLFGIGLFVISFFISADHLQFSQSQEQIITQKFEWLPFISDQRLEIQEAGPDYHEVFLINGSTGNQNGGFSDHHSFNNEKVVLTTGMIEMVNSQYSNLDSQFTISFKVIGENKNYSLMLVNGRPPESGWNQGTYYSKLEQNSTLVIDLKELIASVNDKYVAVEKTFLGLEKHAEAPQIMFSIYPADNSIPPPILNRTIEK